MPKAAPGSASPLLREAEASCRFHWDRAGGGNVPVGYRRRIVGARVPETRRRTMLHPECLAGEFFAGLDPRRGTHLATLLPADKERNADRRRRALGDPTAATAAEPAPPPAGIAPLLRQSYPKTI